MPSPCPESPLAAWYVISLRPQNLHAGVRSAAAALGARTFALSTLRLRALPATRSLPQALACARIIASSPAAVRHADAQSALVQARDRQWFAIGRGTANALRRRGVPDACVPGAGADSEALLALPVLQDIAGQRIGLITAPGGRGLLEQSLRARGAEPVVAQVYRREACPPSAARLRALSRLPATSALLVSSGEALDGLWPHLDARQQAGLRERVAVASSERLAERLRQRGCLQVLIAADARPASLLAALAAHVRSGHFR